MAGFNFRGAMRRLSAAVAFLLCTAVFAASAGYSLRPDDQGVRTRLEGFYAEPAGSLDVVFVGSSAVYAFFSPLRLWRETGLTSYLYATPNQSVDMIRYAIEECRKTQPDALYIVELRAMLATREDRAAIATDLRRLSDKMPYSSTRARLIAALAEPETRLSHEIDLIKYHGRWKDVRWSDLRFLRWGKADPMKGWQFITGWEPIEMRDWSAVNAAIEPDADNVRALETLLEYCRAEGVNAVFLATPFSLSRKQEKMLNATEKTVEAAGYEFWNLTKIPDEIGLDFETDYSDFRHVNMLGAVKCTGWLGARLTEKGVVHAAADDGARWQECWAQYEPREQAAIETILEQCGGER